MVSEQLDQAQRINCKILVQVPQLKYHLAIFFYLSSGSRSFALPSTWTFRTGISLFYFFNSRVLLLLSQKMHPNIKILLKNPLRDKSLKYI